MSRSTHPTSHSRSQDRLEYLSTPSLVAAIIFSTPSSHLDQSPARSRELARSHLPLVVKNHGILCVRRLGWLTARIDPICHNYRAH